MGRSSVSPRPLEGVQLPDGAAMFAVMGDLLEHGPIVINWKASGRGPRLADFAYLIWGTGSWNPRRAVAHLACRPRRTRRAADHRPPYFAVRAGWDRIGVLLTDYTDWDEIRELVTESYRVVAPNKLINLLDSHALTAGSATTAGHVDGSGPS